jgi:hypothetical protein
MLRFLLLTILLTFSEMWAEDLTQYSISFQQSDVKIDTALSKDIRKSFTDDDTSYALKSFSTDLNGDGITEKFIPNEFLYGTGGCPWLIFSTKSDKIIGRIDGLIVYLQPEKTNRYSDIETYWGMGADQAIVNINKYDGNGYKKVRFYTLNGNEIEKYFKKKKHIKTK